MSLVFNSGVSIIASSTILCQDATIDLTAKSALCGDDITYRWSTNETTQSIRVKSPGVYTVQVSTADGCTAVDAITITASDMRLEVGSADTYCDVPVLLSASGTSSVDPGIVTHELCLYNAPGAWDPNDDDCNFTTDVCGEGSEYVGPFSRSSTVSYANPIELRFHIYYSANDLATFRFKLNGNELGSYNETYATGACETAVEGKFPRSFVFGDVVFRQFWKEGADNELTVEIETTEGGILLAGITAEIVTSNERYEWLPATGLSSAFIKTPLASPAKEVNYSVKYTDAANCVATASVTVDVCGTPPIARCKELRVELQDGCEVIKTADDFNAGSESLSGLPLTFSISPAGPYSVGTTNVLFTVTDSNGATSTCNGSITVIDRIAPVIPTLEPLIVRNDPNSCSATVALNAPLATDNCNSVTVTHDQTVDIFANETLVTWTAKDGSGNISTTTQKVIVENAVPVINAVQAAPSTLAVNSTVLLTTDFSDNNVSKATIEWGDLSIPSVINSPAQVFEVPHAYNAAGIYNITVTLLDLCGATTSYVYESVTVFDRGASVEGDGWFNSKAGYYFADKRAAGKAQFHFEAKYKSNATVPTGSITFKFKAGKLDFRSTQLESLIIEGNRATLAGSGKVKGTRGYKILISVVDVDFNGGDSNTGQGAKDDDKIRVKIWDPTGAVVYDTQRMDGDDAVATAQIGGGSIGIMNTSTFADTLEDVIASYFGDEETSVYPNPFVDHLKVQFNSASREEVVIQLIDLSGKTVVSNVFPASDDGFYSMNIPEEANEGVYVLVIKQGDRVEYLRIVRK
jgi:hypothetical protein